MAPPGAVGGGGRRRRPLSRFRWSVHCKVWPVRQPQVGALVGRFSSGPRGCSGPCLPPWVAPDRLSVSGRFSMFKDYASVELLAREAIRVEHFATTDLLYAKPNDPVGEVLAWMTGNDFDVVPVGQESMYRFC